MTAVLVSEQENMTWKNETESKIGSHTVGDHNAIIQIKYLYKKKIRPGISCKWSAKKIKIDISSELSAKQMIHIRGAT